MAHQSRFSQQRGAVSLDALLRVHTAALDVGDEFVFSYKERRFACEVTAVGALGVDDPVAVLAERREGALAIYTRPTNVTRDMLTRFRREAVSAVDRQPRASNPNGYDHLVHTRSGLTLNALRARYLLDMFDITPDATASCALTTPTEVLERMPNARKRPAPVVIARPTSDRGVLECAATLVTASVDGRVRTVAAARASTTGYKDAAQLLERELHQLLADNAALQNAMRVYESVIARLIPASRLCDGAPSEARQQAEKLLDAVRRVYGCDEQKAPALLDVAALAFRPVEETCAIEPERVSCTDIDAIVRRSLR